MTDRRPHEVWIQQYDAAQTINQRYGLRAAFDYLVAEKLLNFAEAASDHQAFARELPRFVSQVRLMFTPDEIRQHIARVERERSERNVPMEDDDEEFMRESPETIAKRAAQFAIIKELLTATELGTS
jgi:hypothetical protein